MFFLMSFQDLSNMSLTRPNQLSESQSSKKKSVCFVCSECKKRFASKWNLKKHFLKFHPGKDFGPKKEFKFSCKDCSCGFNKINSLNNHQRIKHGGNQTVKKLHQCCMCSITLGRISLLNHYANEHNIDIKEESLSFSTFEEATKWKEELEEENNVKYISDGGVKKFRASKCHFYKCHRSGYYNSKSNGIRRPKLKGSKKINFLCPSNIKIVEAADGSSKVRYVKAHVGHEIELPNKAKNLANKKRCLKPLTSTEPKELSTAEQLSINKRSTSKKRYSKKESTLNTEPTKTIHLKLSNYSDSPIAAEKIVQDKRSETLSTSTEPIEVQKSRLIEEFSKLINSSNERQLEFLKKNLLYLKAMLPTLDETQTECSINNKCLTVDIQSRSRFLT